ncbi:24716_t:CDS:2, partial [Dentiscutata erythropus]
NITSEKFRDLVKPLDKTNRIDHVLKRLKNKDDTLALVELLKNNKAFRDLNVATKFYTRLQEEEITSDTFLKLKWQN